MAIDVDISLYHRYKHFLWWEILFYISHLNYASFIYICLFVNYEEKNIPLCLPILSHRLVNVIAHLLYHY